jgi:DNA-binding NarL/FixJ family response regulator
VPPFSPGLAARLLREFAVLAQGGKEDTGTREHGEMETGGEEDAERRKQGDKEKRKLSERQEQVLRLVAAGLTYKEVALRLALSDHTVRYHMSEIMQFLHLENRSQVIAYAGKLDLK